MTSPDTIQGGVDLRVREAFESMGPDDQTRARVLEALREHAEEPPRASFARGHWTTRLVLPLAACLALLAVVVAVGLPRATQDAAPLPSAAYEDVSVADEAYLSQELEGEEDSDSLKEMPSMSTDAATDAATSNQTKAAEGAWSRCPYVVLESGEMLRAGAPTDAEVDESHAIAATAQSEDGLESVACEVADGAFVRYEGEDSWRELVAVDETF